MSLSASAERVQVALREAGIESEVRELSDSTRTAEEAALAIGCSVAQIAKSLVFRTKSGVPLLVIASGANRVNEKLVGSMVGEKIERAPAEFVREVTGFAIGGIPPIGHTRPIRTFLDAHLGSVGDIWAAAGTPHAVFRLSFDELQRMTRGELIQLDDLRPPSAR